MLRAVAAGFDTQRPARRPPRRFAPNVGREVEGNDGRSYVLQRSLGEGGVGSVWAAVSKTNEQVALKFYTPQANLIRRASHEELLRRFLREGRNGTKLRHDCLLRIHDVVDASDPPFIVMDYGEQSANRVARRSQSTPQRQTALAIVVNVAKALVYLHAQGCVHRDVKPANIIFSNSNWVLGDLGIVKWNDLNPNFTTAAAITREGAIQLGSTHYMAPEQAVAPDKVGPASDIYALGITWYDLSEGTIPAPLQVAAGRFRPRTGVERIDDLITRMLRYDSYERPEGREVLRELDELQAALRSSRR